ncbi:MAG TPA: DMT family transporter [Anaerolineales bacterium]|nr:DMT family transporter [Anaerolineales bacterium]
MKLSRQSIAVLQAVFVTVLWASSWVLIKLGLQAELPALTFAGLRYILAFLCLAPFVLLSTRNRAVIRSFTSQDWMQLAVLGIVYYTLTQGSQFLSLAYLSAATASLLLNLTPLVVGISGIVFLGEHPSRSQWLGIALTLLGVAIFFLPLNMRVAPVIGLLVAFGGVVSNAASSLLGRQVNRLANSSPIVITFTSMGIGSLALLLIGVLFQGFGELDLRGWLLIAWLAVVNTAFAFTLWNHTLRTLSAVESSVINSLMMPQIAILAYVFLGEALNGKELLGLVLVGLGVLVVQLQRKPAQQEAVPSPEASAR